MATDHWSRLPPEPRVLIYNELLNFDVPQLRLAELVKHRDEARPLMGTSILRVNKLALKEAQPVFYDLNTIAVELVDFCEAKNPDILPSFAPGLIRHITIMNFDGPSHCIYGSNRPCKWCRKAIHPIAADLLSGPCMHTLPLSYSRIYRLLEALRKLPDCDARLE